jgi:uncharacterized phiE125 gp8 family phage protein
MMHVSRITVPSVDVFTASDLAQHLRLEVSDLDMMTEAFRMARTAVQEIEAHGSFALITQTIRVTLDQWPDGNRLALPIGPVSPGAEVTITAEGEAFTDFRLQPGLRPALWLIDGPPIGSLIEDTRSEGIVIEYAAGFGDTADAVPADLRLAVLDQAAAFYDCRGAGDGKTQHLSPHAARIAARYRRVAL